MKNYIDYRFKGSSSLKAVLPVLVPQLSYDDLAVKDGTMAMDTWATMALGDLPIQEENEIRESLLAYCQLDTLAMVEIFRVLRGLS